MELRNVKITIQQAANWYSSNNDTLKALALSTFSRDEIILYSKKRPHKIVIYSKYEAGMSAIDLDANTYK